MARSFNGTTDSGSVPLDLSFTPRAAVSFWLYWNAYASNNAVALELAVAANWLADSGFVVRPNDIGSAQFGARMGQAGVQSGFYFSRPSAAAWHHVLVAFDRALAASSEVSVYVDGAAQSMTNDVSNNLTTNFGAGTTLRVMNTAVNQRGAGRMADLALWTGATLPSAADAAALAAGRRANWGGLSVQPAYYWPMVEGSGAPAAGGGAITWVGGAPIADPPQLDPFGVASAGMLWQLQAMQANRARSLRRAAARP